MDDNLRRIEETITACHAGTLEPGSHAHSCILALGMSGQRNKLGAAVLHLIEHPNDQNRHVVLFFLSGELERRGLCRGRNAVDAASDAIAWYESRNCPTCTGRGVTNIQQTICPECSGKKTKKRPVQQEVERAVSAIEQSLDWLEDQQRKKLSRDGEVLTVDPGYKLPNWMEKEGG